MQKEVSPAAMIAIIAVAVILVVLIGYKFLGSSSHPDMTHTKAYEEHMKQGPLKMPSLPPGGARGDVPNTAGGTGH
jgi:hypothetical protein